MNKRHSSSSNGGSGSQQPIKSANWPIERDVSIEFDEHGEPQIESVKPIFRPPELISKPVKGYWIYVWIVVVVVVILAWAFLFWYFSNHQAPYAAPLK